MAHPTRATQSVTPPRTSGTDNGCCPTNCPSTSAPAAKFASSRRVSTRTARRRGFNRSIDNADRPARTECRRRLGAIQRSGCWRSQFLPRTILLRVAFVPAWMRTRPHLARTCHAEGLNESFEASREFRIAGYGDAAARRYRSKSTASARGRRGPDGDRPRACSS